MIMVNPVLRLRSLGTGVLLGQTAYLYDMFPIALSRFLGRTHFTFSNGLNYRPSPALGSVSPFGEITGSVFSAPTSLAIRYLCGSLPTPL